MKRSVCIIVAGVALVALTAVAQPRGRAIQESKPKNDAVSTNLNQSATRNNFLLQLNEAMTPHFEVFNPAGTEVIERPVIRPPAGPVIQSKRVRELLDQKKNWQNVSLQDKRTDLTPEEMTDVPQSDEYGLEKGSTWEFYQRMEHAQAGVTNRLRDARSARGDDDPWLSREESRGEETLSPFQARLQETEKGLQSLLKMDSGAKFFPENPQFGTMPEQFTTPRNGKGWQEKAQELRLDQFRQMMQADYSKPGGFPGVPSAGGTAGFATPGDALKPVTFPGVGRLTGAGIAGAPAAPETKPPSVAPLNPLRTQFPSPMSELPRRKF